MHMSLTVTKYSTIYGGVGASVLAHMQKGHGQGRHAMASLCETVSLGRAEDAQLDAQPSPGSLMRSKLQRTWKRVRKLIHGLSPDSASFTRFVYRRGAASSEERPKQRQHEPLWKQPSAFTSSHTRSDHPTFPNRHSRSTRSLQPLNPHGHSASPLTLPAPPESLTTRS